VQRRWIACSQYIPLPGKLSTKKSVLRATDTNATVLAAIQTPRNIASMKMWRRFHLAGFVGGVAPHHKAGQTSFDSSTD